MTCNLIAAFNPKLIMPTFMLFTIPLSLVMLLGAISGFNEHRRVYAMLATMLLTSWIIVVLPGWWLPHYYQLVLPFLAIGAGWGLIVMSRPKALSAKHWRLSLILVLHI